MNRISTTATLMIPLLIVFAALYVFFTAGSTIEYSLLQPNALLTNQWVDPRAQISMWQRISYLVIWLLPVVCGLAAVLAALRLMLLIRKGVLFDNRICRHLRRAGIATSLSGAFDITAGLATPTLLSWANPEGPAPIQWYFDSEPAGLIVCGGGFYLMGWIMAEARKLSDENREFV